MYLHVGISTNSVHTTLGDQWTLQMNQLYHCNTMPTPSQTHPSFSPTPPGLALKLYDTLFLSYTFLPPSPFSPCYSLPLLPSPYPTLTPALEPYRQLRTRRALLQYKVYGDSALLALNWRYNLSLLFSSKLFYSLPLPPSLSFSYHILTKNTFFLVLII